MAAAWWLAAHRWCRHGAGARATAEQQRGRGGVARGRRRSGELRARRRRSGERARVWAAVSREGRKTVSETDAWARGRIK